MLRNRKSNGSRGQIAVILAIVLPVIFGAIALGADFAVMYFNWVQLQKAADSAALAGAGYLPANTIGANSAASTYAKLNGRTGDTVDVTVDNSATPQWVRVQMSRVVPYSFGRALGLTSATLNVLAKAGITSINAATGLGGHFLPIGLDCPAGPSSCPAPGTQVTLLSGQIGPGDWGTLQLPGMNGVSDTEQVTHNGWVSSDPSNPNEVIVANPNQGSCATAGPSCVNMQPGNGDVKKAAAGIQDRLADSQGMDLDDSAANPNPGDPRVVQLPMVDFAGVHGKSTAVPVLGFAEVWIDRVNNDDSITVTFIQAVSPGNIPGSGGGSAACVKGSSGVCTVVLEQ
jgi:Flp pilus assembly protein TadG